MSIPKIIHYCWFGGHPLPESVLKCVESWKKYCPDYEIIQWNETNYDVSAIRYIKEAYEKKQWAFVSDYARLQVIYEHGGIYLDTDVELIRPLDDLLEYEGFMGFQNEETVATGLGFGAIAGHPVLQSLLQDYEGIPFIKEDGTLDQTPCPDRNTACLKKLELEVNGTRQEVMGVQIFPPEYFSPMDWRTGKIRKTENTYSIHHYDATWLSKSEKRWVKIRRWIGTYAYNILRYEIVGRIPNKKRHANKKRGK